MKVEGKLIATFTLSEAELRKLLKIDGGKITRVVYSAPPGSSFFELNVIVERNADVFLRPPEDAGE